jgi:hypothetical protein
VKKRDVKSYDAVHTIKICLFRLKCHADFLLKRATGQLICLCKFFIAPYLFLPDFVFGPLGLPPNLAVVVEQRIGRAGLAAGCGAGSVWNVLLFASVRETMNHYQQSFF